MPDKKTDDVPNALPVAGVLVMHGAFLAACGAYGAALNDWAPKAMHSLYAGLGGGSALAACAAMSVIGNRKLYMIGVHVGLLLQLLFTRVISVQAYKAYAVLEKVADGRFALFCVMGVGSMSALVLMRVFKPKKKKI